MKKLLNLLGLVALALTFIGPAQATTCGFGSDIGGGQCRGYLVSQSGSNQTWNVPADWTNTNQVDVVANGGAAAANGSNQNAAGCGAAHSFKANITTLTPSGTATFFLAAPPTSSTTGTGASGADTFFCKDNVACATIAGASVEVGAKGGGGGLGNGSTTCTKALASASVPSANAHDGGTGGFANTYGGCSGGGAGGPNGNGANGACSGSSAQGGSGAGAADGGSNGTAATATTGGNGGAARGGSPAGGTGTVSGNPASSGNVGSNGSGPGGTGANTGTGVGNPGQTGSTEQLWDSSHGPGSGGSGAGGRSGGTFTVAKGGDGGLYGGGGGAGGYRQDLTQGNPGAGGASLIVITYTPSGTPPSATNTLLLGFP